MIIIQSTEKIPQVSQQCQPAATKVCPTKITNRLSQSHSPRCWYFRIQFPLERLMISKDGFLPIIFLYLVMIDSVLSLKSIFLHFLYKFHSASWIKLKKSLFGKFTSIFLFFWTTLFFFFPLHYFLWHLPSNIFCDSVPQPELVGKQFSNSCY